MARVVKKNISITLMGPWEESEVLTRTAFCNTSMLVDKVFILFLKRPVIDKQHVVLGVDCDGIRVFASQVHYSDSPPI